MPLRPDRLEIQGIECDSVRVHAGQHGCPAAADNGGFQWPALPVGKRDRDPGRLGSQAGDSAPEVVDEGPHRVVLDVRGDIDDMKSVDELCQQLRGRPR
jgi:hypothetical protein